MLRNSLTMICLAIVALLSAGKPLSACEPDCPFNVKEDLGFDLNGIAWNPRWSGQTSLPSRLDTAALCERFTAASPQGQKRCTSDDVYLDTPKGIKRAICELGEGEGLKGHVNWTMPVTVSGTIARTHVSFDRDYDWDIVVSDSRLLTTDRPFLHAEADSRETADRFSTDYWKSLRASLFPGKTPISNGRPAIVSGLLNLDSEHGAYTEVHPIFAFAILADRINEGGDVWRDRWALFVRNWGNEGFCSHNVHAITGLPACLSVAPGTTCEEYGLELPIGPANEARVLAAGTDLRASPGAGIPVLALTATGVQIRFPLPEAHERPIVYGEITIRWVAAPGSGPAPLLVGAALPAFDEENDLEEVLDLLKEEADPKFKKAFDEILPVGAVPGERVLAIPGVGSSIPKGPALLTRPATPRVAALLAAPAESAETLGLLCSGARNIRLKGKVAGAGKVSGVSPSSIDAVVDACSDAGLIVGQPDANGEALP
jgi:hypothetical protein